jgi:ribosomal-protein-alanine N-acetyltransferase
MFNLFAKSSVPSPRPIGGEWSAECARIHASSFAYPWQEADIEQLLLAPEIFAAGAIDAKDQTLAGFIMSRVALDEAEILTLAVAPERRRCGIGQSLLSAHLAGLASQGVNRVFLEVDIDNAAARALYERFGFRQVGERKAYYRTEGGKPASALVMRLDLT